jgi:hypothetical protein
MRGTPLTVDQIVKIKKLLVAKFGTMAEIGATVSVSAAAVCYVANRITGEAVAVPGFDKWRKMRDWNRRPKVKFLRRVMEDNENGCWNWTGKTNKKGYALADGVVTGDYLGHRTSYRLYKGDIPDGLYVLHKCNNRRCVNPDHLYAGTQFQNMQDSIRAGTHVSMRKGFMSNHKLTEVMVIDARRRFAAGESQPSIAADMGVHKSTILNAVNGHTWGHVKEGLKC